MKTMIGAAAFVAVIPFVWAQDASAQTAHARAATDGEGKTYFSLSGGAVGPTEFEYDLDNGDVKVETDSGFAITAAVGRQFSPHLRGEVTLSYMEADIDVVTRRGGPVILIYEPPGGVQAYSVGVNAYYDFATSGVVRPYVGGGIGLASLDINDRVIVESGLAAKLQGVGGVRFVTSPNVSFFIEGRADVYATSVETIGGSGDDEPLGIGQVGVYGGVKLAF